jgi:hypothetical protein
LWVAYCPGSARDGHFSKGNVQQFDTSYIGKMNVIAPKSRGIFPQCRTTAFPNSSIRVIVDFRAIYCVPSNKKERRYFTEIFFEKDISKK